MTLKSPEFKAAMSAVRKKIATAKRRGSSRGFADYQGCRFICYNLSTYSKMPQKPSSAESTLLRIPLPH